MSGGNKLVVVTRRRFLTVASASAGVLLLDACADSAVPTAQNTPTIAQMATPAAPPAPTMAAPPAMPAAPVMVPPPMAPPTMMPAVMPPVMMPPPAATMPASAGSPMAGTAMTGGATMAGTPRPAGTGAPITGGTARVSGTAITPVVGQLLVVRAMEYSFQTMASVPGGVTTIRLQNVGKELHQAQLVRLNDGVTVDQFTVALKSDLGGGGNTIEALVAPAGGPNAVVGGGTAEVIQDLQAGQYVLLCLLPNPQGMSHAALGMILPLTVTAPTGPAVALPLVGDTITLANDDFMLPAFTTGRKLYQVVNAGAQPADFQIIGIAPGKTLDDVKQYLAGPQPPAGTPGTMASMSTPMASAIAAPGPIPVTGGAGIATLLPGQSGIVVLDLTPGEYAAWTGDPSTGILQLSIM